MRIKILIGDFLPRFLRYSASGILAISVAAPVHAQLEEVIVTATKRETALQDTPVAVSAFTGDELVRQGVYDTVGLSNIIPNVTVATENARDAVFFGQRPPFGDGSILEGFLAGLLSERPEHQGRS